MLALGLIVGCSVVDTLLAATICAVFGWFVGVAGLVCNLLAPRFDWINEAGPCKQSAAVFLTIFGSYFVMLAFGGLFALLYSFGLASTLCLAACAAVLLLLTAGKKYAVEAIQPVDMFPWTHHIENIVYLKRTAQEKGRPAPRRSEKAAQAAPQPKPKRHERPSRRSQFAGRKGKAFGHSGKNR